jgi:hypothetical protein
MFGFIVWYFTIRLIGIFKIILNEDRPFSAQWLPYSFCAARAQVPGCPGAE